MAAPSPQLDARSVEAQLLETVREMLVELNRADVARKVTLHSHFERDLGLGSLDLVELLVRCESRLEVELPDEIAEQAETPGGWVRAILQGGQDAVEKPVYRIVPPSQEAPPAPASARTLIEVLERHADADPGRIHVHLLEEGSGQGITCGQLLEAAKSVAAGLVTRGLRRNDTVAVMLPNDSDFFQAFFGVMLAGGIPVPVYPPARPDRIEEYVRRQVLILRNAKVRFLISFDRVKAVSRILRVNLPDLIDVTTVATLRQTGGKAPAGPPADVAMIQYTSGSTGNPKGVVLTHANVLANVRAIGAAVGVRPDDAVVSWLPLASDMGLVGCWLFSLYYAAPITVISPLEFLMRPESWLWAIHDSRGTLSAAPNYAFELCTRRIPAWTLEGIDLSCWRCAVNAGEQILPDSVDRFTRRFRPFGFRAESMVPGFGLAECSVGLLLPPLDRLPVLDTINRDTFESRGIAEQAAPDDPQPLRFFSVGRPLPGHQVRIVDEAGREVADRKQGHLQFRGPSQSQGYFGEQTAASRTVDGWIDTGDLAYRVADEIVVTGRTKDLIVREGRNLCPLDAEAALRHVPGLKPDGVAAIGVPDVESGTERLVIVAETSAASEDDVRRLRAEITATVEQILDIPPDVIELIPPGRLPKTSNGKLRRVDTVRMYRNGRLGASDGPPWLQILRLWRQNLIPLAWLGFRRALAALGRASVAALAAGIAFLAGLWIRRTGSGRVLRLASRALLRLKGQRVRFPDVHPARAGERAVFVANRSAALDPLVMTAWLPAPVSFSGDEVLRGLPRWAAFLVQPLINDAAAALEDQSNLVIFPDGPVGAPAVRSRFRLDAFRAAARLGAPLVPVAIRDSRVAAGGPIVARGEQDVAALRDRVRTVIIELDA